LQRGGSALAYTFPSPLLCQEVYWIKELTWLKTNFIKKAPIFPAGKARETAIPIYLVADCT